MDEPGTHYAKSGDVRIAYQVTGSGPLDLVFVPGFVSNLDVWWEEPIWARSSPLPPRPSIKPPQLPGTSRSSPSRAARWGLQVLLPRARRRDPTPLIHRRAGDRLAPAPSGSTARLEHAGTLRLTFVFPQVHQHRIAVQDGHCLAGEAYRSGGAGDR
jgi:hypothetical protein